VASDVGVVHGDVSLVAGGLFLGSVAFQGGGSTTAIEDNGSATVAYLSTQSDVCISDHGLQVMGPALGVRGA